MEKFESSSFANHLEELEFLRQLGFDTNNEIMTANSAEEVWEKVQQLEKKRDSMKYHIDGVVVKLNDNHLAAQLGVVGKTPRGWCAVKFSAEEVTTKCVDITWQVGRTGKLTPVAELEPVLLAGTIVKRATLHNYKEFSSKGLRQNDTVVIRKAGDIIPEIKNVLVYLRIDTETNKKFLPPKVCPACNAELITSSTEIDLICPNQQTCPAQILGRLSYFCQRNIANIVGLSDKHIQKFITEYGIQDIPNLYKLPYSKISQLEGFGQKSVDNLKKSIDNSRQIEDYKFLAGLGIEGIGIEVAQLICKAIAAKNDIHKDIPATQTYHTQKDQNDIFTESLL